MENMGKLGMQASTLFFPTDLNSFKACGRSNVTNFRDNKIYELAGISKSFLRSFVVHAILFGKLLTTFQCNRACGNERNEKQSV